MADTAEIKFKIDDRELSVRAGHAGDRSGAAAKASSVPSFCYYPGLALQAACRMCLVEVEKAPKLQTACTLVAVNGMVVRTDTPQVHEARKSMLEFLLTNHPLDCPVCDKGGECELQDMTFRYGADRSRFVEEKLHTPEVKWSNLVYYDAPRCILCFRCVRVCDEGMDVKALGVGQRGAHSVIIPNREDHLECEECGMCIDICPVGALTSGTYRYHTRPWEMQYVSTVCAHCSNGCKTTLSVRNHEILRANNRDLSGFNSDFLCVKGRFGFDFTRHPDRLTQPLVRRNGNAAARQLGRGAGRDGRAPGRGARAERRGRHRLLRLEPHDQRRELSAGAHRARRHRAPTTSIITAPPTMPGWSRRWPEPRETRAPARPVFATMRELASAPAFLLIGNDATEQNPLVAWQIRAAIRHHGARLYVVDSREHQAARARRKLSRRWSLRGRKPARDSRQLARMALRASCRRLRPCATLWPAKTIWSSCSAPRCKARP